MHIKHSIMNMGMAMLAFLCVALGLWACTAVPVAANGTPTPAATTGTAGTPASGSPTVGTSGGWNSFMLASQTGSQGQYVVLNSNLSGKSQALTQYVVPKAQFGSIAPNGKDVLYQTALNDHTQYYTTLAPRPGTGFFYEVHNSAPNFSGNAIWMPDSRHALVLNPLSGVWSVDVQTGQAQKVVSLPVSGQGGTVDGIQQLLAYRDGYIYFQGGGGGYCIGAICRLQISTSHPTITQYSARQTGNSNFLLSPDGRTIYYCNTGPAGQGGLYVVNSDGTNSRILRQSATGSDCGSASPVGFAQDNGLVAVNHINGKFEVVELGATPQQDRVLLADAAPGATSLCVPGNTNDQPFSQDVCPAEIALSPYAHGLVVQGTLPNGTLQLWATDLTSGKQQVIKPTNNSRKQVQLLGWDQLPVCSGDNNC